MMRGEVVISCGPRVEVAKSPRLTRPHGSTYRRGCRLRAARPRPALLAEVAAAPGGVGAGEGVVAGVGVETGPARVARRVGLGEAPGARVVAAGAQVVLGGVGVVALAREARGGQQVVGRGGRRR